MKKIKKTSTAFKPKTDEAKELLKKIKKFNDLAEYFKSDDAKKILEEGLNIKKGEKYAELDDEDSSKIYNFISPDNFRIEFGYKGDCEITIDMVNVGVSGKIGKKVVETIRKDGWPEELNYKQIDEDFKPKKRSKFIELEEVLVIKKGELKYDIFRETTEAFKEQGIYCKFTYELDIYSEKIWVNKFLMNDSDFERLYQEALPLNVPCMLHENTEDKKRVARLESEGYIDNMAITKIKNRMKKYFEKTNTDERTQEFEFYFSGNSLFTFRKAELRFTVGKADSFMKGVSSYKVETIKN